MSQQLKPNCRGWACTSCWVCGGKSCGVMGEKGNRGADPLLLHARPAFSRLWLFLHECLNPRGAADLCELPAKVWLKMQRILWETERRLVYENCVICQGSRISNKKGLNWRYCKIRTKKILHLFDLSKFVHYREPNVLKVKAGRVVTVLI